MHSPSQLNCIPRPKPATLNIAVAVISLLLVVVSPHTARAALLAYEGFDYAADTDLSGQNGGTGWATPWSVTTGDSNVLGSLSYTDSIGNSLSNSGNSAYFTGLAGAANVQARRTNSFLRNDASGTTWVSFIAAYNANFFYRAGGFQLHSNTMERISIGKGSLDMTAPGVWTMLRGGSAANTVLTTNVLTNITFHVLRIDHKLDASDDIYLFINPKLNAEPALSEAATNYLNLAEFSFNGVRVFASYASTNATYAEIKLDEIRVGDTYADVTPYTPGGGGGTVTPSITQVQVSGSSVILSVTGAPSTTYTIVMATNVNDPITNVLGTASSTDGTGAGGSYTDANALTGPSQRFYRAYKP